MRSDAILVTGASGPLGQQVLPLLAQSARVVGVTRRIDLDNLYSSPQVEYRRWNSLDQAVGGVFSTVVHLAAAVDFATVPESVLNCVRTNILTTARVVEFCKESLVRNLVYASTVSVYANDGHSPKGEASRIGPSSPYAASKWMGELVVEGARIHGISPVILRFAGIYGHADRSRPVLNQFITQALRGEILRVQRPTLKRDYAYIKDAALAISRAVHSRIAGTFNIATGRSIPLRTMAEEVAHAFGATLDICESTQCEPVSDLSYDVSRARRELGFECQYDLSSALGELRYSLSIQ